MFAFDRSALAVLVPLALLAAVVLHSNRAPDAGRVAQAQLHEDADAALARQTVAANLPSR